MFARPFRLHLVDTVLAPGWSNLRIGDPLELTRLVLGLLVAGLLSHCFRAWQSWPLATQAFTMAYAAYAVFPVLHGWTAWVVWLVTALTSAARLTPTVRLTPRQVMKSWRNKRGIPKIPLHTRSRLGAHLRSHLTTLAIVLLSAAVAFYGTAIVHVIRETWLDDRLSVLLSGFLLAVFVGNLIVARVVRPYREALPEEHQKAASLHLGTRLGWIERALVFVFISAGQPEAAALAITAKSLVRIPEVREHQGTGFGQYVIVGTLTSLLVAVATGILVRIALGLPAL